ncbi:MAG: glutaredoxin 3 [Thermaurantiacus sp.]
MKRIVIYTRFLCSYCHRAKALLKARGAEFEEHDISFDRARRAEMVARSNGRTTVPQIFIGDLHVGGSDELAALDAEGRLEALLA